MQYTSFCILGTLIFFVFSNTTQALTISPARIEISGDPGQVVSGDIEIINEEMSDKTFFTSFENFEPRGDSGTPYFIGAKNGLATWISSPSSVQVKKGEQKLVSYSISIPKNAEPGGYFAAIFFGTGPKDSRGDGEVSIGGRIGALVLLRVNGEIKEGGGLNEFFTKNKQRFFSRLPIHFFYRLNNTGGDRIVPRGEVVFKNTFRYATDKILANEREGSVLPNSIRKIDVTWGESTDDENLDNPTGFFKTTFMQLKNFHFGWYTAVLKLSWGETNQTAEAKYNFFVIPWQLFILTGLILFCVFIAVRRYNKFIVSKAIKSMKE